MAFANGLMFANKCPVRVRVRARGPGGVRVRVRVRARARVLVRVRVRVRVRNANVVETSTEHTMRLAAKKRQRDQTETAQAAQTGAGALLAPKPATRPSENLNWRSTAFRVSCTRPVAPWAVAQPSRCDAQVAAARSALFGFGVCVCGVF